MGFSPSDIEFQKSKEAAAREIGWRRLMVHMACLSCKWRSSLKVLALAYFANFVSLFNVSRILRWAGGVCQV